MAPRQVTFPPEPTTTRASPGGSRLSSVTRGPRPRRYIAQPAFSEERAVLHPIGQEELQLKTPWRDGTTHVVIYPKKLFPRLAALMPWQGLNRASRPSPTNFNMLYEVVPASQRRRRVAL